MESLGGLLFPLLILLLFIPIFLQGRKQRRMAQEAQQLQASLEVGDVVTTTSGLRGTVVDASYEDTIDLEIAEGVVTTWMRAAVRDKVLDGAVDTDTAPDTAPADPTPATPAAVEQAPAGTTPAGTTPNGSHEAVTDPADTPSDANGTPRP
jgi:preprotein translocase subunit YajC